MQVFMIPEAHALAKDKRNCNLDHMENGLEDTNPYLGKPKSVENSADGHSHHVTRLCMSDLLLAS